MTTTIDREATYLLPGAASSTAVATAARATIDLSAFIGQLVDFRADAAANIRAASAAASLPTAGAMTADYPLAADTTYRRYVDRDHAHLAVYIAGSGNFYWWATG